MYSGADARYIARGGCYAHRSKCWKMLTGADGVRSETHRVIANRADTRKANRFQASKLAAQPFTRQDILRTWSSSCSSEDGNVTIGARNEASCPQCWTAVPTSH